MVARGFPLPARLREDAIVEALFEVRFNTTTAPEILIGRVSETDAWKKFESRRLPLADFPAAARETDPNLRFAPIFEFNANDPTPRAVRVGPHVLSYHRKQQYVGWHVFEPELRIVVETLFKYADGLTINRLGLRYLNALTNARHGITSISELDIAALVAGNPLTARVNLNYLVQTRDATRVTVRVATPEFVQGPLPENTTVYIDVDVFTNDGFESKDAAEVVRWITEAHEVEKTEFFQLLTEQTIRALAVN